MSPSSRWPRLAQGLLHERGTEFKLLADTDHTVSTEYGSLGSYNGTAYASGNTFLIDPSGVIRKVYLKVKPPAHSEEVLADLDTLQAKK